MESKYKFLLTGILMTFLLIMMSPFITKPVYAEIISNPDLIKDLKEIAEKVAERVAHPEGYKGTIDYSGVPNMWFRDDLENLVYDVEYEEDGSTYHLSFLKTVSIPYIEGKRSVFTYGTKFCYISSKLDSTGKNYQMFYMIPRIYARNIKTNENINITATGAVLTSSDYGTIIELIADPNLGIYKQYPNDGYDFYVDVAVYNMDNRLVTYMENGNECNIISGMHVVKDADIYTTDNESMLSWLLDVLLYIPRKIMSILEELFVMVLAAVGDGILLLISWAVKGSSGILSIGSIVFGTEPKFSIDFWQYNQNESTLAGLMSQPLSMWYNIFKNIAIVAYLISFIGVGIKTLLVSTGEQRASFITFFKDWLIGIGILFLFPYVMKYTVKLNMALITSLQTISYDGTTSPKEYYLPWKYASVKNDFQKYYLQDGENPINFEQKYVLYKESYHHGLPQYYYPPDKTITYVKYSELLNSDKYIPDDYYYTFVSSSLGKKNFVTYATATEGKKNSSGVLTTTGIPNMNDAMMYVRYMLESNKRFPLLIVYFIMIGQLIVLILVYYKRVIMMAFMIMIFPLIAMTYAIDKLKDGTAQSLSIWIKEFVTLVFTQSFHAISYVILVTGGLNAFINSNGKQWLYFVMATIFLFQGERIVRSIFGMKSSAGTIGDLAETGVAAYGLLKSGSSIFSRKKQGASREDEELAALEKKRTDLDYSNAGKVSKKFSEESSEQSENSDTEDQIEGGAPPPLAESFGDDEPSNDMEDNFDAVNASNQVSLHSAKTRSRTARIAKFLANRIADPARLSGFVLGATIGLAQGNPSKALALGFSGAKLGGLASKPIQSTISGISNRFAGNRFARKIEKGKLDDQLDLTAIGDSATADAMRKALAEQARKGTARGIASGETKFWKEYEKHS